MLHWLHAAFETYLAHPLRGNGELWWSGPGSDLSQLTLLSLPLLWWRTHNCHVKGCWRLQWHPHPDHGHPVCRRHHPHEISEQGARPVR